MNVTGVQTCALPICLVCSAYCSSQDSLTRFANTDDSSTTRARSIVWYLRPPRAMILHELQTADPQTRCVRHVTRRELSRCCRFTAEEREHFAGDVARIGVRREEDICRCDFFGLPGTLHRGLLPMFRGFLWLLVRDVERCPDRTRRHAVHTDPFLHEILCQ